MELILTAEQESAVTKEHGSLDYLQEYVGNYANYLIGKQAEDARITKVKDLDFVYTKAAKADRDTIDAIIAKTIEAEKPVKPIEDIVESIIK